MYIYSEQNRIAIITTLCNILMYGLSKYLCLFLEAELEVTLTAQVSTKFNSLFGNLPSIIHHLNIV